MAFPFYTSIFGTPLTEGVRYDATSGEFTFDFQKDEQGDVISLAETGLYKSHIFENTYYFGYRFNDATHGSVRSRFLDALKMKGGAIQDGDVDAFVVQAINKLDRLISLPSFHVFVMPESMSYLNRKMGLEARKRTDERTLSFELVKSLPAEVTFDYDSFHRYELDQIKEDGSPKHTARAKDMILAGIEETMEHIRKLDYFSLSRDFKKPKKYRKYLHNFLKFPSARQAEAYRLITQSNVLILDDVASSGTTLQFVMRTLRTLNDTNELVVFTLLGKDFQKIETISQD